MTIPCEQKEEIAELVKLVRNLKDANESTNISINSLQLGHNELSRNIARMCTANEELAIEVRSITRAIAENLADTREFRINLEKAKEERDIMFKRVRKIEDVDLPHIEAICHNHSIDLATIKEIIKDVELIDGIDRRLIASEHVILVIKVIGAALAASLVGLGVALIFGIGVPA